MFSLILRILSLPLIPFRRYLPPSPPSPLPQPRNPPKDNNNPSLSSSPSPTPAPLVKSTVMYVYLGKLDWKPYGQDETFVITLPNGPARAGDPAYLFSQWTKDARGAQKANWFLNLVVDKVSKTASGDDVFTLKNSHYYSWEITTQKVYGELKVTMSNPNKEKSTMTFNRIWKSESQTPSGSLRIWTGKINWPNYATNEMATFIVPEGFGKDKPVLAVWQWTKNGEGKPKNPNVHVAKQSILSSPDKTVKFEYNSFYHVTCTWQQSTERLAVHMKGSGIESNVSQEIGDFALAVHLDRHSHPPESAPNKAEVELRLPQAQPSLSRIQAPMPFPKGLVDTLTHAQAFIDQAGYLAKYAEQRFAALDTDLHARDHQLTAAETQVRELLRSRDILLQREREQQEEAALLKKLLQKEQVTVHDLEKEIAKLRKKIRDGDKHDEDDHRVMEELRDARIQLKRQLDQAEASYDKAKARIQGLTEEIQKLEAKIFLLQSELDVLRKRNEALTTDKKALTQANEKLVSDAKALQDKVQELTNADEEAKSNIARLKKEVLDTEDEKQAALDKGIEKDRLLLAAQEENRRIERLRTTERKELLQAEGFRNHYWDILNKQKLTHLITMKKETPPQVAQKKGCPGIGLSRNKTVQE
ncbi:uncharacterized protein BDZ83DRAFT_648886 [Colletotrichum acutatum]|uniref:Uncharacterized protein n=1 Tax=Glomerella acutata TaxID=27357 RepID=A0AAD8XIU3_GLOAC|nr:uncharacterized protein BDZ83DRAFT_648886 [Colletotrichum acutatum]KAK1728326.1 hypothetical protein BDZ83DRAFT_648886 [Colletotrichum acutatum]